MLTHHHGIPAHLSRDRTRIKCGARGCPDILCWVFISERVGDVIFIHYSELGPGPGTVKIQLLDFPADDWKLLIRKKEDEP
jgi:hypothetical protein